MRNHVLDAARVAAAYSVVLLHISFPEKQAGSSMEYADMRCLSFSWFPGISAFRNRRGRF